jgi:hypothetical protein
MEKEKTVPEMIQEIADKICNDYCKYPETVRSQVKDVDEAESVLMNRHCKDCPLLSLI